MSLLSARSRASLGTTAGILNVYSCRFIFQSAYLFHQNPLGLPRSGERLPPKIPTKGGAISKQPIPNVKRVIAVASGKGGVGKSTVAANLALSLALNPVDGRHLRVGLLDLDIFGPSIPKIMGLEDAPEPELSKEGHLLPLNNHGIPCMSMGFLLPKGPDGRGNADSAVVWRGLMVQKATQQLLFDVDWRGRENGSGLDILVIDMPPGTGDVALTLGQLVRVDGAVVVSTPQDVALIDVKKGISMFRKVSVPILGLILNMSYFKCPNCSQPHFIFGSTDSFRHAVTELSTTVLGELPLVSSISSGSDAGLPVVLPTTGRAAEEIREVMTEIAKRVVDSFGVKT